MKCIMKISYCDGPKEVVMNLMNAEIGKRYIVSDIKAADTEVRGFLFRLGCYSGEPITVIARKRRGCTVAIKDGRYSFDRDLAEAICV